MSRILLIGILCALFFKGQSQTLSQLSGNGPTANYKGYTYNFSGGLHDNCYNADNVTNYNFNQFENPDYSFSLDTDNGYLRVNFTGSQTGVMVNHFTYDNCILIENSSYGGIDLNEESHQFVEIKLRSSVDVEAFGMYIAMLDGSGFLQLGDGTGNTTESLTANLWTTVRFPVIFQGWDGMDYDPAKVVGIALYANNSEAPHPNGHVEIDYMRIGVAAKRVNAVGVLDPGGNAYAFNFDDDSLYACFNHVNASGNTNFNFAVDQENNYGVLSQLDAGVSNDVFVMNFTDPDCFLSNIDLTDEADRYIRLRIKAEEEVSSLAVVIAAKNTNTETISYSKVLDTYSLDAGVWTDLVVSVSMETEDGFDLDPTEVEGIVFIVNPQTPDSRTASIESLTLAIEHIKVGELETTTSLYRGSVAQNKLHVYPNPIAGGFVTIELPEQVSGVMISLIDITGREFFVQESNTTKTELNLTAFPKGSYTLRASSDNAVYTQKLLVY